MRWSQGKPPRRLVFDIENRPLSYWYDGNPTAEVTSISWKWVGDDDVHTALMRGPTRSSSLLDRFRKAYDESDVVIGHNIRTHDLPILNAVCVENDLPLLTPKMTVDTLRDLVRWKDIPKSLEYLCDLLGCPFPKLHMTQHSWRRANRLEPDGVNLTRERVEVDVRATEWVYLELLNRKLLVKGPKLWRP